jgi:protein ImuA
MFFSTPFEPEKCALSDLDPAPKPSRTETVVGLRRLLSRLEGVPKEEGRLSFSLPALDAHLPQGGLAFGALHEIGPETEVDLPAAFGFMVALLGRVPAGGPLLLVLSEKLARCGRPHGHGLAGLGLDPARVILVETRNDSEALWATEEALRSGVPAAVASAPGARLDLKASQRLLHAARDSALPLLLVKAAGTAGAPTAATRWRIGAAPAASDRFGLLAPRWRVALERCRNGRPGEWMLEFDHVTHRFGLAAPVAGASVSRSGAAESKKCSGAAGSKQRSGAAEEKGTSGAAPTAKRAG